MSRSGYSDELEQSDLAMWRGRVASATRGKRGQRLLKDLLVALDAMPEKELIADELAQDGKHCALGVLGAARGLPIEELDPHDPDSVSSAFDIAACLAQEIVYQNDECGDWRGETPAKRWERMHAWVSKQIKDKP